jgi:hypothetical protein
MCECPGSEELCSGTCTDTSTDNAHCGNCTTQCTGEPKCSGGMCNSCPAGQTCGGGGPNVCGSPGLFGNATDAEVYVDNVKVNAN